MPVTHTFTETCFRASIQNFFLLVRKLRNWQGLWHGLGSPLAVEFEKTRHESIVALPSERKLLAHTGKQTRLIHIWKMFFHQWRDALPDDWRHASGLWCVEKCKQLINLRHRSWQPERPVNRRRSYWYRYEAEQREMSLFFCTQCAIGVAKSALPKSPFSTIKHEVYMDIEVRAAQHIRHRRPPPRQASIPLLTPRVPSPLAVLLWGKRSSKAREKAAPRRRVDRHLMRVC